MTTKTDQSVAAAVLSEDEKSIALVFRRDVPVWALPGGAVDDGETPEAAILREIYEETSMQCSIVRKVTTYLPVNKLTKTTHFFMCKYKSGTPQKSDEVRETKFFPLQKLPKLLPPPYPFWIRDLLDPDCPAKKQIEGVSYLKLAGYFFLHPILVVRYLLAKFNIPFNTKDL